MKGVVISISNGDFSNEDMPQGYPKKSSTDEQNEASQFYQLGRQAATVEKKLREINENLALGIMQKLELANLKMQLENVLTEILRRQILLDDKVQRLQMEGLNTTPTPPINIPLSGQGAPPPIPPPAPGGPGAVPMPPGGAMPSENPALSGLPPVGNPPINIPVGAPTENAPPENPAPPL